VETGVTLKVKPAMITEEFSGRHMWKKSILRNDPQMDIWCVCMRERKRERERERERKREREVNYLVL
jgi:hypothetical protein